MIEKRITVKEGIDKLMKLRDSHDTEQVHIDADNILLEFVPDEIKLFYMTLKDHAGFWYA